VNERVVETEFAFDRHAATFVAVAYPIIRSADPMIGCIQDRGVGLLASWLRG
jgi:hypothetical protein